MIDDGTFMNEFKKFRDEFETRIKKKNITYYDNDCYLIDNGWYNELEKNVKNSEKNLSNKNVIYNSRNIGNSKVSFPQKFPVFINDINLAIDYLKSNNKPQLISTKLMNKIYKKEKLKNMSVVKYYSGFNNLIIMFMKKEYNSGLLLFNPLDNNNKNNIIFSFKIRNKNNEDNTQFYDELLQMKNKINETLIDNLMNNKIISHYKIIKKTEEINNYSSENLLKIFISIFYYEKSISSDINEIFSNSQSFNLINPEWLINFKHFYHYEIMDELLNEYENEKKGINYSNLDKHINEILLYVKGQIKVDEIELPNELIDYNLINPPIITKNRKEFKCQLIPFKIMNLIKDNTFNNKNISIKPNMVFAKDNHIYIIDSYKIIFGNINNELLFFAKYIFSYNSKEILEKEKDVIYSTSIMEYIQRRNCKLNHPNTQKLINSKSKELGEFIILNYNDSKTKNNNNVEKNDSTIVRKEINIKINENNNKYSNKILVTKKVRYHSKYGSCKNYNISQYEIDEKEENKDMSEKKYHKSKQKKIYYNNLKNHHDSLNKTQQIADEYDLEMENNLNNEIILEEDLQEKIKDLEEDNKNKEIELNNTKKTLNEKEEIIKKMNEDNENIKNELEKLKINNNNITEENKVLLNNLEKNKEETQKKEEEITNLKSVNKNEKEKYEKLIEENNSKNNKLLEEKENELLKYKTNIKKYEDNEIKLKKLEDIDILIEYKNKEMDEKTKNNNDLIKKNEKLEEEINKNQKEYEKILKLIEDKKKEKEDINAKYEELKNSYNQLKGKEEELKNKELEIQKKDIEWKNFEKEQSNKKKDMKKKEEELENKEKEMKRKEEELKKREEEINNKEKLKYKEEAKDKEINEEEIKNKEKELEVKEKGIKDKEEEIKNKEEKIKNKEEEIKNKEENIKNKEEEIKNKEENIKNKEENIKNKKENIKNKDEEIKNKEEEIKNKEEEIKNKEEDIKNKEENIKNKEEVIKNRDEEIKDKEKKLKTKEEEINNKEKEIKTKQENINKKEEEIKGKKEEMNIKEKKLEIKENEIRTKEEELKDKENKLEDKNKKLESREEEIKKREDLIKNKEEEINKKEIEIKDMNKKEEEAEKLNEKKYKEQINIEEELKREMEELKDNEKKIIQKYENDLKEKQKVIEGKEVENKKIQTDLLNKEKEISKINDEIKNLKENNENIINNLNKNLTEKENEKNLKIENLEKNIKELNEILTQKKNDYEIKIKEYENKMKEKNNNEEVLKLISEKEKELNNKISFLEDKENLIEKEMKELNKKKIEFDRIKKDNINLVETNKMLLKEIEEKNVASKTMVQKENLLKSMNENQKLSIINEKEEEPILIGLNNIGATCFMNSVLQCLSQTKPLTDYFLNEKNLVKIFSNNIEIKNKNEPQLSPIYCDLINKLWNRNGPKSFSPNDFMNQVEKMNPLFKKGEAGDSKDFIIFIFEQLHKELKGPVPGANQGNVQPLNQYDKYNSFNYFFNDFKKDCSIISDIFFGFNETTNECLNCKAIYNSKGYNSPICYNYGIFNCLIFPLEEVKNMKYNNIQNNQNNVVSLYDCFCYNQKSEIFTGENRNYCNVCKQVYDSIYTSKVFIGPNILVLILNRGKGNIYDVKLQFAEQIDITQFVLQRDKPQLIYNLYGVITHIGQSGPNAHFVASCKSSINNKWYRFNDAMINPINDLQKEVIEFGTPYILFYKKQ